jgi:hypothetical protein
MKSSIYKRTLHTLITVAALFLAVGCSKDKKTNVSSSTASGTYYYDNSDSLCYSNSTGLSVSTSNCNKDGSYYLSNGTCHKYDGDDSVGMTYCGSNATNTSTHGACYGQYYYFYQGQRIDGTCNGSNCAGYRLYNSSGRQVDCT